MTISEIQNFLSYESSFLYLAQLHSAEKLCNRVCFNLLKPQRSLCTTIFNREKFCVPPTMRLCVLCGSRTNSDFFPQTALTDR